MISYFFFFEDTDRGEGIQVLDNWICCKLSVSHSHTNPKKSIGFQLFLKRLINSLIICPIIYPYSGMLVVLKSVQSPSYFHPQFPPHICV